jgi:hypothetical protein
MVDGAFATGIFDVLWHDDVVFRNGILCAPAECCICLSTDRIILAEAQGQYH